MFNQNLNRAFVLVELTPASKISFLDSYKKPLRKCCNDPETAPFLERNHLKTHCDTSAVGQVVRRRLTVVGPPAILAPSGRATSTDNPMKKPKARKTSTKNSGGPRSAKALGDLMEFLYQVIERVYST